MAFNILPIIIIIACNHPYSSDQHRLPGNFGNMVTHRHETFTPVINSSNTHHENICQDSNAVCVLPIQCPAHFYFPDVVKCDIFAGKEGICCRTGQNHTDLQQILKARRHIFVNVDEDSFKGIARHGHNEASSMRAKELELLAMENPPIVRVDSASYSHYRSKRVYGNVDLSEVSTLANRALEIALATRALKDRHGINTQQLEWNLIRTNPRLIPLNFPCPMLPRCPDEMERYRRIDGSCNNLINTRWGMQFSPYSRLLPPSYEDGIWSPRLSTNTAKYLPSPRLISTTLFSEVDSPDYYHTLMLSQFGQFISHDITFSVDNSFPDGKPISCCTEDGSATLPPRLLHHACMPIEVPEDDPFYFRYNMRCMNFVRSVLVPKADCSLGYGQQMNKITHFIDASSVYGSNIKEMVNLRSFDGGKLKVFQDYGRELLPLTEDRSSCVTMERGSACFNSGDTRTNQMITLVATHTLFLREHNRIARELEELNPHWTDDRLFWESRRILIAEMQVIVYTEFLPCLLGETTMEEFDLHLAPDYTYSSNYDLNIEPSITNEFTAAAYRFGHSMIDGLLKVYGKTRMEEAINIPEVMFQPSRMRKWEFFDEILNTLTTESIQNVDNHMSEALTKYMFKAGNPFGIDLAAINIQRGRDHGLRPYNDYRQLIGLPRMKNFEEFGVEIGTKLEHIYESVDDIDLWVGGLLEPKEPGSILGPTFKDIVADQFSRLKKGDRYFFENDPNINPSFFTLEQLEELKSASMARIICDNSDHVMLLRQARNAFKKPGVYGNELLDCQSFAIPTVDLSYWQE